ncbi:RNA polymerase sporulation-specific sigma factor [Hypnocyclicus thermotrophus]|uniref:RNA polymerase sigma factor SigS n=1 Tax=Hypnocyclicus thermotrophus TaxID=1627895 RepID=A0AA46I508_9FUSO|nr:sigma-70 family RNA polymerase sigma factor [Hypnocyclicus thermotrophus]TDT67908.1 RNA polymerase sporulation-specific sigma factor [Hypnocyclicus thermotrophus]
MTIVNEISDELIEQAKYGDAEAINEIFTQYKNFVFLKSKNYFLMGADKDDLIQEGMIGLLKAIRGYDKNKLASFKTFASICIKRQLITAIKTANSQKNIVLNNAVGIMGEKEENREVSYNRGLESYISYDPEELFLTKEQVEGLKNYLNENLSNFEKEVFRYMVMGLTYKDIAEKLNKKVKSVDNAIQRIKRKSEMWIKNYREN